MDTQPVSELTSPLTSSLTSSPVSPPVSPPVSSPVSKLTSGKSMTKKQKYLIIGAISIIIIIILVWYLNRSPSGPPGGSPNGPPNGPPSNQCGSNADCGNQVCSLAAKACVKCDLTTNFCTSPQICDTNTGNCGNSCSSSEQCSGKVCNSTNTCVPCDTTTNLCPAGQTCSQGVCGTPSPKKAIFYHQQWDTYGNTDNNGYLLAGATDPTTKANIATTTGRNFQISDIPDDVTDIAYAFWWVDAEGNVGSGDDGADHEKPPVVSSSAQALWPDPSALAPNSQGPKHSPNFTVYQYPVMRGSVGKDQNNPQNYGNFGAILALNAARQARGVSPLKVSLTVGGWTYSTHFSDAVKPANQQNFVNSCIAALTTWSDIFSGINFDWEYISDNGANLGSTGNTIINKWGTFKTDPNHTDPSDVDNFASFLYNLRQALNKNNLSNITIGIPVTPAPEKAQYDINRIHQLVDEIHIMSYDMHSGAFDYITGFHSNPYAVKQPSSLENPWGGSNSINLKAPTELIYPTPAYSTEDAIRYYLGLSGQVSDNPNKPGFIVNGNGDPSDPVPLPNVPASKLFLGVAFYTRGFANSNGIYQPTTCSPSTFCSVTGLPNAIYAAGANLDTNSIPYNQAVQTCGTETWGPVTNDDSTGGGTMAAYCYDSTNKMFLSFDNQASIAEKIKLVNAYNLGGIIAWDNASDLRSVAPNVPTQGVTPNTKSIPTSLTYSITNGLFG